MIDFLLGILAGFAGCLVVEAIIIGGMMIAENISDKKARRNLYADIKLPDIVFETYRMKVKDGESDD